MLERLKARHDWDGILVLAGPTVGHGSSREQEARWLADHPQLAQAVIDVGAVSEAEKAWLFERSTLVLYPSVVEGFGLVPFEAAAQNTPCMWAPVSSLSELLPDDAAAIVPWDEQRSAERALALMQDPDARRRNLEAIRTAAEPLTWDATAAGARGALRGHGRRARQPPPPSGQPAAWPRAHSARTRCGSSDPAASSRGTSTGRCSRSPPIPGSPPLCSAPSSSAIGPPTGPARASQTHVGQRPVDGGERPPRSLIRKVLGEVIARRHRQLRVLVRYDRPVMSDRRRRLIDHAAAGAPQA